MKGNEKHRNLCEIARKKEIKKKKSIIKFKNRMKMMENNLKIIESKNLEEKKALLKLNKKNNSNNKYKIYLKEQKRQIKLRKYINDNLVDNNNNFRFNRSKDKLNVESDNLLKRINEKYNNILHATIHY
jgi:outer membrane lipopolysaccharide assembly protein LptE/RlpB